ncbi:MAG: heavy metal translocating P-type ATPase [Candidatus Anammoxibacter sp.]
MEQNKTINSELREFYEFPISGLNCVDCAWKIEHAVSKLKWVKDAKVYFSTSLLKITTKDGTKDMHCMEEEIEKEITGMGFGIDKGRMAAITFNTNKKKLVKWSSLFVLTAASGLSILAGLIASTFGSFVIFKTIDIPIAFYLLTIGTGGYYIGRRGLSSILNLRLDINFLMCIAVVGAACIGEWLEGATVIFLFLVAQLLETYTLDKARNAIRSLMELSPKEALVKDKDGERKAPVDTVKIGDIILVRPGERIPLDGKVVDGTSTVNQSSITGESISIEKSTGDEVYAGTINENGALDIKVTHISNESTLAKIIHLIEDAQSQKAPFQSFVDNFAKYYTPIVMLLAVLVASIPPFIFHESFSAWFYRALVLLVISCPCALVISTPVSLIAGITNAARNGILFKGGVYLEHIGSLKAIAFDKTGTLTKGTPVVTDIITLSGQNEDDILRIAASIEARSEHSIANAILNEAKEKDITIIEGSNFQAITGKGAVMEIDNIKHYIGNVKLFNELDFSFSNVDDKLSDLQNEGKTTLLIGADKTVFGIIAVADEVRKECRQTITELYDKGINKIVMLTGDYKNTARAISVTLKIDEFLSELSPEDKVNAIKSLIKEHGKTGMVGDGINDAPALTAATVGIAMGKTGTDIALESADVTIMGDDLSRLPIAIELGRQTMRVIKQNIGISIMLKAVFLALIVPGITTLWMAVGADMGASLIVIMNGLRLLRNGNRHYM